MFTSREYGSLVSVVSSGASFSTNHIDILTLHIVHQRDHFIQLSAMNDLSE